jgi:hypothetical protein
MLREWADRAEAAITAWPGLSPADRDGKAQASIAAGLARYPSVTTEDAMR